MARRARNLAMVGLLLGSLITAGCGPGRLMGETVGGPGPAPAGFDAVAVQPGGPPAMVLALDGGDGARAWAAGRARRGSDEPITPDAPVRIASVTKTFLAAALLRLWEQGRLDLDAPIRGLLSDETRDALDSDGYDTGAITTRQLLAHTSGLADHWGMRLYQLQARYLPGRRWTRIEQVRFAMRHGAPVGAPGERFFYSDTGYLVAAEVLERASGQTMAQAVRTLLRFEAIGLNATWFETLEPRPPGAPLQARQYIGWQDGSSIHASFDLYGAGGLVASAPDLARFFRALAGGSVFDRGETFALMAQPTPQSRASGADYGLGLSLLTIGGRACIGHGGFWSHLAWVCPDTGEAGAVFVTDTERAGAMGAVLDSLAP